MKRAIILMVIIMAGLLAGCSVFERFKQAENQYLETRVSDLVEEMTTVEPASQATVVDESKDSEPMVEETVETPVVTEEVTEQATPEPTKEVVEETHEPTEEPTVEPTPVSDDPAVYLGDPDWVDENKSEFWTLGDSDYDSASIENGKLKIVALADLPGWRIANTVELGTAYIEADVKMGSKCSGKDAYGIVFRVPKNVGYNQGYFFGITCDGFYNLRAWDGLKEKDNTLIYYTASGAINKGANQTNRLGVMTVDDRILLYVNGEYVNEVVDETYDLGYFGVFINRDKTDDLTVYVDRVRYWLDAEPK
jgi:hypothetical protein